MLRKPIAISLSPNTDKHDVKVAIRGLFDIFHWKKGPFVREIKNWFRKKFSIEDVFLFDSGRSALFTILKSFNITKGDEVLVQAFTCVAVPDPILWVGAKPVFIDIDETLNVDPKKISSKISKNTKALIVQHTFGIPAKIDKIKSICQKNNILLIEDCAHSLGAFYKEKPIGTFGDASFFSFGRDKIVSSVSGGAAFINKNNPKAIKKMKTFHSNLTYPDRLWILQNILHPIAFSVILPLYTIEIGKIILVILQKLKLLNKPVEEQEKKGKKPKIFPSLFPDVLARLLISQVEKLEKTNKKRREVAKFYQNHLKQEKWIKLPVYDQLGVYLRYNIQVQIADFLLKNAKKQGVLLGNWYRNIIDPKGVSFKDIGYTRGSCPKAEQYGINSVNLPTYSHLTTNDLKQVVSLITDYANKNNKR